MTTYTLEQRTKRCDQPQTWDSYLVVRELPEHHAKTILPEMGLMIERGGEAYGAWGDDGDEFSIVVVYDNGGLPPTLMAEWVYDKPTNTLVYRQHTLR